MTLLTLNKTRQLSLVSPEKIFEKLSKIKTSITRNDYIYGITGTDIPSCSCVYRNDVNKIDLFFPSYKDKCIGISVDDNEPHSRSKFMNYGILEHEKLFFSAPYGRPVWVSKNGLPTDIITYKKRHIPIGFTLDEHTMFVNFDQKTNENILKTGKWIQKTKKEIWKIPVNRSHITNIQFFSNDQKKLNNIKDYKLEIKSDCIQAIFDDKINGMAFYTIIR